MAKILTSRVLTLVPKLPGKLGERGLERFYEIERETCSYRAFGFYGQITNVGHSHGIVEVTYNTQQNMAIGEAKVGAFLWDELLEIDCNLSKCVWIKDKYGQLAVNSVGSNILWDIGIPPFDNDLDPRYKTKLVLHEWLTV